MNPNGVDAFSMRFDRYGVMGAVTAAWMLCLAVAFYARRAIVRRRRPGQPLATDTTQSSTLHEPQDLFDPRDIYYPTTWELIREENAQAGQLVSILGLLIAASTFSLNNSLVQGEFIRLQASGRPTFNDLMNVVLVTALAVDLIFGVFKALAAMEPTAAPQGYTLAEARERLRIKRSHCRGAIQSIKVAVFALLFLWMGVISYGGLHPLAGLALIVGVGAIVTLLAKYAVD